MAFLKGLIGRSLTRRWRVQFEVVFGVSASNWPLYDLEHGKRAIGYEPQDVAIVPEGEWER